MKYVLSLGTNLGDRKRNIEKAIEAINSIPYTDVIKCSSIYETEPVGYARQDNFYNIVAYVESQFDAHEMLGICLGIEAGFGRVRGIKNGPRTLDIDLILGDCGDIDTYNLQLPHPRYHQRRFVLEPMLQIFPEGEIFGVKFDEFIPDIEGQEIWIIDEVDEKLIAGNQ